MAGVQIQEDRIDDELEDGECSDNSDDTQGATGQAVAITPSATDYTVPSNTYRSRIPQIVINSDEDDSGSSDEDCPSTIKRSKNRGSMAQQESRFDKVCPPTQPFVNPLLSDDSGAGNTGKGKRRNNIWGSVLTEQVLTQDIQGFGVDRPDSSMITRDVESYDFTKKLEDDRPDVDLDIQDVDSSKEDIFADVVDLEGEVKQHEKRKRKRPAKERLGRRSFNKNTARDIGVNDDSSTQDVVKAITDALNENNMVLFTKIVENVGSALALRVFHMTEDVEKAGGMMTNDGYRRRTPGGTYIQLLKNEPLVTKDQISAIFAEDEQRWKDQRKQKRKMAKAARKHIKKQMKSYMDVDRPETPSPTDDVLGPFGDNNDFDANDIPERPATPEPKDVSSDGEACLRDQDDDEEEEDDIADAIAKAKAAILKRQREMAKASSLPDSSEMRDVQSSLSNHSNSLEANDGDCADMDDA